MALLTHASYKAYEKYARENPEWAAKALSIVNTWGSGKRTLLHAIAEGLQETHEMGKVGELPETKKPATKILRRTR
jgi:ABC-type phosphonate transport system ATPase subunit